ncbi:MAG: SPOR domain-containing protein, partial [SAR324 cluster bacterium]|nr:SPOR domain-containing protein [SAR324 cluster bacterium]
MTSFKFLKKTGLIIFCLMISILFSACDKVSWFQKGDSDSSKASGVVETDWKNTSEIKLEIEIPQPPKTQAVADKEQAQNSAAFSVQIGAFLKKMNATQLISEFKHKGYEPTLVVVEAPGKQWNLVHVGSYTGKNSAVAAAKKLAEIENMETAVVRDNTIIKVQRKSAPQAFKNATLETLKEDTVANFAPEQFSFQVGGLRTKENADKLKIILQKKGYAPYIKKFRSSQSREDWYIIRIGYYETIELATDGASQFMAQENIPSR